MIEELLQHNIYSHSWSAFSTQSLTIVHVQPQHITSITDNAFTLQPQGILSVKQRSVAVKPISSLKV